jgi:hypothetical protein
MADKSFIYGFLGGAIAGYLTKPRQQQAVTQITQPTQPQIYDYIINIYADRIKIFEYDGSKTALNTIDELNTWLTDVKGKNILIWNNGDMTGTIRLTSNKYVVMGKPTKFQLLITQSNIDLIYLAQSLYEGSGADLAITNVITGNPMIITQVDNVNIFTIGASTAIYYNYYETDQPCQGIYVTAINPRYVNLMGIMGRVISTAHTTEIRDSQLTDGLIAISETVKIFSTKVSKYFYVVSNNDSQIWGLDVSEIDYPVADIQGKAYFGNVNPGQTMTTYLTFNSMIPRHELEITGIYENISGILMPLTRNDVDIQVDTNNFMISATNNTSRAMNIVVSWRYRAP